MQLSLNGGSGMTQASSDAGAGRRTRTPDLLITKRIRSIQNGPFGPFFRISAPNKNR